LCRSPQDASIHFPSVTGATLTRRFAPRADLQTSILQMPRLWHQLDRTTMRSRPAGLSAPPRIWRGNTTAIICAALLLVFAALSYRAVSSKSPTYDEPLHAASAWMSLHHGDFRINTEDPPLFKFWAALGSAATVLGDRDRSVPAAAQLKQELQDEQQTVRQRLAELQREVDELRQRQRDLQAEVVAAEQATLAAGRRRDQAEMAHEATQQKLADCEQQLQDCT